MSRAAEENVARIAHDPDALEEFYRGHVEEVQRFIARRVADPHVSADLTAEVFLAAIGSAHTYRSGRGAPIAWLYGIARNVVASQRRRRAHEERAVGRISGRALVDAGELARIEERIDAEQQARRLYLAMAHLSERQRAVLELVALDGLAVAEAATALRISPVTARVRLYRARRTLQQELAPPATGEAVDLSSAS